MNARMLRAHSLPLVPPTLRHALVVGLVLLASSARGQIDPRLAAIPDPVANYTFNNLPAKVNNNLVVVVHGWGDSPASFNNVINNVRGAAAGWDVFGYDWATDSNGLFPPVASAALHGEHLASQIIGKGYEKVHFISHSLGGASSTSPRER